MDDERYHILYSHHGTCSFVNLDNLGSLTNVKSELMHVDFVSNILIPSTEKSTIPIKNIVKKNYQWYFLRKAENYFCEQSKKI